MKVNRFPGALILLLIFFYSGLGQSTTPTPLVFPEKSDGKVSAILGLIYDEFTGTISEREDQQLINRSQFMIVGDKVRIEASAIRDGNALARELKAMGASEISVYQKLVNAWIPIKNIPQLQELNSLLFAEVVYIIKGEIGSVDSEADSAMVVKATREKYCIDGSGVNIGILSDSYDFLGGASSGVSSGDLPGVGNPNGYTTPVTVVLDAPTGIDEGRAMAELVHDLAPGAALFFNSALFGQAAFANAILGLANTHSCDVIVDDIRYFEEPFYMDGWIAKACDKVYDLGVPYFASAGNYAQSSYEAPFNTFTGGSGILWHDFDPGAGVDTMQSITVNAGSSINLTLQWDDPWGTLTPNNPSTDLDIYLLNAAGTSIVASSTRSNLSTLEPTEFISISAPGGGGPVTYNIVITRFAGPSPSAIKWVIRNASGLAINEFPPTTVNAQATGYGHSNAAGANAVGACAWFDSPAYGTNPPEAEPFTSSGGVQIRYDTNGVAITPVTRNKPEFTANDGISNTFFGGGNMFFGTSAAAPDAAAVAVLMLEADSTLTPSQVRSILANSAIDMNTAGFDFLTGAGLIQADSALNQVYDSLCNISNIAVQTPPSPEPGDTTYSVELRVTFSGAICTDSLTVNGENFGISGAAFEDVTLTGLPANGQAVNVTASFSQSVACSLIVNSLFNALLPAAVDTLVISEIMYDPPESSTDSLEFIEIYNPTTHSINLTGYAFTEGVSYTFGNVAIAAGGYVVVCEDSMALFNQFGANGYEWSGALSNGGEDIVLKDNNGNTVDSVDYDDSSPWPTGAGGDGPSIVLCDWTADNNAGANWTESASGTGIIINGNELKGSPGSSDQACLPCVNDSVEITQVTCDSNLVDTTVVVLTNSGGCDSVITTFIVFDQGSSTVIPPMAICEGDSLLIFGVYRSLSGTYCDTLQNINGCDSILCKELIVNPSYVVPLPPMNLCQGDSMLVFGVWRSVPGLYSDTLLTADGCDSILVKPLILVPTHLQVLPPMAICEGDSLLIFGVWRSTSGVYFDTLVSVQGCDSIIQKQLIVNPAYKVIIPPMVICQGDSLLIFGTYRDTAGIYYDTLQTAAGCDSIVCKELLVDSVIISNEARTICDGDSSLIFGKYETMAGVYSDTNQSNSGCDSIHIITLLVNPGYSASLPDMSICEGDSMLIFGVWRDTSGTYYDSLLTVDGCDSIISKTLIVNPKYLIPFPTQLICEGDSALIFGVYQTTTGTYYDTLQTIYGCDSILIRPLMVNPVYEANLPAMSICQGDSMLIFGHWQSTAGIYCDTLQSLFGCDSVVCKELIVDSVIHTTETRTICDGDSSLIFGVYQTLAGVYSDTSQSVGGCDSIHSITLIVQPGYLITFAPMSICEGDSMLIFGNWQSVAGVYYDSLVASGGCDSVLIKQLIVNPVYLITMSPMSICEGDSMLVFGNWQSTSGIYYDSLQTAQGCDSVIVKQLIVNTAYKVVLPDMSICEGDSMLIFGIYRDTAGTYYDSLLTMGGCDSIICKKLIVDSLITTSETRTICDGDSSLIFDVYQSTAGVYIDTSQSAGGCDSIHTITLNVLPTASGATTIAICEGDSILLAGVWQTAAGSYIDTLAAANGCDSVVTTALVVLPIDSVTVNDSICAGDSLLIAGVWVTTVGAYPQVLTGSNGCDSVVTTMVYFKDSVDCPLDTAAGGPLVCVSDSSWTLSTVVTTATSNQFPWPGVTTLPAVATFTLPVDVGQPYPWNHIYKVDSSEVITAESGIRYYRKTFELSDPAGIKARFRMFVDDDMQIFINRHAIALEDDMGVINYRTINHDLQFNGDGTYTNGNMGGDPFDVVTSADMDTVFKTGTNELILAIRNRTSKPDKGGFSFRMDLDKGGVVPKSAPVIVGKEVYGLVVFPNPTDNYISVSLESTGDRVWEVAIIDLSGRLISSRSFTAAELGNSVILDVVDYAPGLYMIRVSSGDKSFKERFIKF